MINCWSEQDGQYAVHSLLLAAGHKPDLDIWPRLWRPPLISPKWGGSVSVGRNWTKKPGRALFVCGCIVNVSESDWPGTEH